MSLTRRDIEKLEPDSRRRRVVEGTVPGLAVTVHPSGRKVWTLEYRPGAGGRGVSVRRVALGNAAGGGALTLDEARKMARDLLADARRGDDPATKRAKERAEARAAITFNSLADEFLAARHPALKPRTLEFYAACLRSEAVRALGKRRVLELTRQDAKRLLSSLSDGNLSPSATNARVRSMAAVFKWGRATDRLPEDHVPPTKGVELLKERRVERFLDDTQLAALARTINAAGTSGIARRDPGVKHSPKLPVVVDPSALDAIRLLILTGARLREILHLRWEHVDLQRALLALPDSKSGQKTIILPAPALEVLSRQPKRGAWVFPGKSGDKPRQGLARVWTAIREAAGLPNVRLHDLRHSFAATAVSGGTSLRVIGELLGHADSRTTERYAGVADSAARRAAEAVGSTLAAILSEAPLAEVVPLRRGMK